MTNSFLHQTAVHILGTHGKDLQRVLVLMPNQTGINFFRKALAQTAHSAVWAPVCLTPSKQMEKASGLAIGNRITLAAELHRVYQAVTSFSNEPFERFFPWADLLLNDFDDIDKSMANAKVLYANLAGLKNINEQFAYLTEEQIALIKRFWKSYEEPSITESKERFLRIWEKLYEVYRIFTEILPQKGYGYEGLLHRRAAENPEQLFTGLEDIQAAYVIGFNRLNACEKQFFSALRKKYNTQFFYDAHPLTVKDTMHEAGKFYRESTFFFPHSKQNEKQHISKPDIEIISVSGSTTAIKYAAGEIEKIIQENHQPDDILVMLPDEKQLTPLLYSLPESVSTVNITSGLALSETPIISLLRLLYNVRKMASRRPSGVFFRASDVGKLLQHPYLNFGENNTNAEIIQRIKSQRRTRPERGMLIGQQLHERMFSLPEEMALHSCFVDILRSVLEDENIPLFEKRIIQTACEAADGVSKIIQSEELSSDDKAAFILLNKVLRGTRIPFEGEPVLGLQMMGPLETRNLDFKTVIIPAMGDDQFPGAGTSKTYIPFTLRRAFGLPLPEDRAAELSHIFFRLLQRAEKVVLICNTSAGAMTTGEPSRFIFRLEADDFYAPLLRKKTVVEKVKFKEPLAILIEKTEAIMDKLNALTDNPEKAIYPTAINTYIDCQLRFYFRYIAGIKEVDELSDIADHAQFGSIFHWIMEWMYTDYLGKTIHAEDIENIRGNFDALSEKAFKEHFGYQPHEVFEFEGETLIQREVIRKYVNRLLDIDAEYAPFTITGLELGEHDKRLQFPFKFPTGEGEKTIHLAGKIDRVDEKENITRILDYKTGADELRYTDIPTLFDPETPKRNKAALQTWLYGLIYGNNFPDKHVLQAGIISVRGMFETGFDPIIKEKTDPLRANSGYAKVQNLHDKQDEFIEHLRQLFTEIYNKEIPFVQTEKLEKCLTCPYKEICKR